MKRYTMLLSVAVVIVPAAVFGATSAGTLEATIVPTAIRAVSVEPVRATTTVTASPSGVVQSPTGGPQEASGDYFIKLDGVEGESTKGAAAEGSAAVQARPQEGVEPDEIDYDGGAQPLTPDFSILLGGGSDDEAAAEGRGKAVDILIQEANDAGLPVKDISIDEEGVSVSLSHPMKLLGFIPVSPTVTVEVDAQGEAEVDLPWWAFLATGKNKDKLGQQVSSAIGSAIVSKQDALKSVLNIIR